MAQIVNNFQEQMSIMRGTASAILGIKQDTGAIRENTSRLETIEGHLAQIKKNTETIDARSAGI